MIFPSLNSDFHNPNIVAVKDACVVLVDLTCDLSRNTQVLSFHSESEQNTPYVAVPENGFGYAGRGDVQVVLPTLRTFVNERSRWTSR